MSLFNKLTIFSILILLTAFVAVPAMANTMSATWSIDLDPNASGNQSGWAVTLTYATAPGTTDAPEASDITVADTAATVTNFKPTATTTPALTATTKVFTFNVQLADVATDADITLDTQRRVTLINSANLASTSIYTPKLKSITAPKSARAGTFEATIEFEAQAAAVAATTNPAADAIPGIGPATGLRAADIGIDGTGSSVLSVKDNGNRTYTVTAVLGTATTIITLEDGFPHQDAPDGDDADDTTTLENQATVIYDNERPTIGPIVFKSLTNRDLDTSSVTGAFDVYVDHIADSEPMVSISDTPATVADEDEFPLMVEFTVEPAAMGATVSNTGRIDGKPAATITPKKNTTSANWPATTLLLTVTVTDGAGNFAVRRAEFTVAPRTGTPTGPDPGDDDMTAPTVTITDAAGTDANADKVIFTFTFSEPLATMGENAFTIGDLDVSNSQDLVAANLVTTDNKVFKLTITPTNDKFPVKVSFISEAKIADAATPANLMKAGNNGLGATDTYTPPGVLGVEIDAPENLALGVLTFIFTFAELPSEMADDAGQFTVSDIRVSNAEPLVVANLTKQLQSSDDTEVIYELDVTPMDATKDVTVQLKARSVSNGKEGDDLLIAGEISSTWTPPVVTPETPPDTIMIPKDSFVVVVRNKDAAGANGLAFRSDVMVREWPGMPNLERLFYTGNDGIILERGGGGALILKDASATPALVPGTVGISEIMWGIDATYLGEDREDASQWIELHNLNTTTVANVTLSWETGREITDDDNITGNLAAPVLDVVTNFFNDRPGNPRWEVKGSNGSSVGGVDFVSMARNGDFNLMKKDGDQYNQRYTRTGGATKSRDGRNAGHWSASTAAYLNLRTTLTDQTDVTYKYVGTPGRVNSFSAESQPHIRASRRDVPASPVIINEVANRLDSHKVYEWIELRNVTDSEVNLRNYLISIVTSNNSDAVFYQFPANDNAKIAPQGVLLLVASDPTGNSDHPLAAGWNVDGGSDQAEGRGFGKADDASEPGLMINATSKYGRYKVADPDDPTGMFGGDKTGLPDDGKFVLILRSWDNHEGQRSGADNGKGVAETGNKSPADGKEADLNKIVDIAGWDDNLAKNQYPNPVSNTSLWPLFAMGGPFSHNKLDAGASGAVHARRHATTNDGRAGTGGNENKNEAGKAAFARNVDFTGIGYKRKVRSSKVLGGTPGYHGIEKGKVGDLNAKVTISEIMLSQAGRGYPQWIELYNSSSTQAVQLDADDGWRLVIENPNKPIGTINFKSKGKVKRILPKQTVLVVSGRARSAGSDFLAASSVFPETRTFNVYKEIAAQFDMKKISDPFLNPTAFHIKLIDGKGTLSDDIGNLDGNARTSDTAKWEYPDGMTADGKRTSLIRIYDDGVVRTGVSMDVSNVKPLGGNMEDADGIEGVNPKYSWVHTVDTNATELRFVRHTWYGIETDYGTPGVRAGQVLPVRLSFFRPTLEDGKVVIRWTTESELDNAGFNILRSQDRNGEFTKVNDQLIQGKGTTAERSTYKWVDTSAKPGAVYYYQIEDVSFAGERQTLTTTKMKGLISAKDKLTTKWGELKNLQ